MSRKVVRPPKAVMTRRKYRCVVCKKLIWSDRERMVVFKNFNHHLACVIFGPEWRVFHQAKEGRS